MRGGSNMTKVVFGTPLWMCFTEQMLRQKPALIHLPVHPPSLIHLTLLRTPSSLSVSSSGSNYPHKARRDFNALPPFGALKALNGTTMQDQLESPIQVWKTSWRLNSDQKLKLSSKSQRKQLPLPLKHYAELIKCSIPSAGMPCHGLSARSWIVE